MPQGSLGENYAIWRILQLKLSSQDLLSRQVQLKEITAAPCLKSVGELTEIDNLFGTLKTSSNFVSQMNTISIAISDLLMLKLQKVAAQMNVSIEELVLMNIESSIAQRENPAANAEIAIEVIDKFYTLATEWQSEVAGMSSTAQMSQHPAYQEIINMGSQVVPLLLSELKKNPLYWLAALNEITGENPIKPEQRGRVKQMASAWIEWGKDRGYAIE